MHLFRSEQNSVGWKEDLVERFSKTGELVVDLFFCTFLTATACLESPWYRHLLGCNVDTGCMTESTEALDEAHAR